MALPHPPGAKSELVLTLTFQSRAATTARGDQLKYVPFLHGSFSTVFKINRKGMYKQQKRKTEFILDKKQGFYKCYQAKKDFIGLKREHESLT